MNKYSQIAVCGSIAFDRIMNFDGDLSDHLTASSDFSVSLLCKDYVVSNGGTGANMAYYLGLMQTPVCLVGAVGPDGKDYIQELEAIGVDVSQVQTSTDLTATFHGLVDNSGKQIGSFYAGAMSAPQPIGVDNSSLVIISAHDPEEMISQIKTCQEQGIDYIYDPSQQLSVLAVSDIEFGISKSKLLIINSHELSVLESRLATSLDELQKTVPEIIITKGSAGSVLLTGSDRFEIPAVTPSQIVDPTGAGDAYRAGLLHGILNDFSLEESARYGATVASFCVEFGGGQNSKITKSDIIDRHNSFFE